MANFCRILASSRSTLCRSIIYFVVVVGGGGGGGKGIGECVRDF